MRRLFGRNSAVETSALEPAAVAADKDAHGCLACPHMGAFDEGSSTLLPLNGMTLDGGMLEIPEGMASHEGFEEELPEFDPG